MFFLRAGIPIAILAFSACGNATPMPAPPAGPAVDPATTGTVTAVVKFEGAAPAPQMMRLEGDPKCVQENGGPERADESLVVGPDQALQNVFAVLAASGAEEKDIVSVRVYLTDTEHFAEMNAVYATMFSEPYPSRTTVYVGLRPGLLVEIDALAVVRWV